MPHKFPSDVALLQNVLQNQRHRYKNTELCEV